MNPTKLRRGMLVQFPDGTIERVTRTFRFPANTKWRKAGPRLFQTDEYLWATPTPDIKVLGFVKP